MISLLENVNTDNIFLPEFVPGKPMGINSGYRIYDIKVNRRDNRFSKDLHSPKFINEHRKAKWVHFANREKLEDYLKHQKVGSATMSLLDKWTRGNYEYLIHNPRRFFYPYKNSLIFKKHPILGDKLRWVPHIDSVTIDFINFDSDGPKKCSFFFHTSLLNTLQQLLEEPNLEHRIYLSPSAMRREILRQLNI